MRFAEAGWRCDALHVAIRFGPGDLTRSHEADSDPIMEPRRIILAVVLMAMVLVASQFLFPPPPPAPGIANAITDSLRAGDSATNVATNAAANAPANAPANAGGVVPNLATSANPPAMSATQGAVADSAASAAVITPVDTAVVTTPNAVYRTTNLGAQLIGAAMTHYPALSNGGRTQGAPAELAPDGAALLALRLVVPGDTIALNTQRFTTTQSVDGGHTVVRYDAMVAARAVTITYSFLPDSYRVNVSAAVAGAPANTYLLVDLPPTFRSSEVDPQEDYSHLAYAYKPELKGADKVSFSSVDPGERELAHGPLAWAVAKNKYFLVGILTPVGQPGFAELDVVGGVRTGKKATLATATAVIPMVNGATAFEVYAGPQEFKRLVAMGREFETSNPYGGFLQGIIQPFATMVIRLLIWMKATLGLGYGWILVIFGVSVRIILWPLNQKAMRSSLAMQRLQPELSAIQTKHKGDPQKLQAELTRVYKEHGMSPFSSLSGCLPMLIPMPVFFALFFVFQNTIEFRGRSFLWLADISIKDPYYALPILVAITAMLLSYIGMKGVKANEQQKMMMYIMPAMMLFIFLNMASGLNLYYFIQNLASLPQQWLISRERGRVMPLVRG